MTHILYDGSKFYGSTNYPRERKTPITIDELPIEFETGTRVELDSFGWIIFTRNVPRNQFIRSCERYYGLKSRSDKN
ncbi:hypothetical protein J4221_00045 [Candidatus Pacearchaeota archaeon]|nr:hypothetical protein [Candidatus Pacearchaeota archaeon]